MTMSISTCFWKGLSCIIPCSFFSHNAEIPEKSYGLSLLTPLHPKETEIWSWILLSLWRRKWDMVCDPHSSSTRSPLTTRRAWTRHTCCAVQYIPAIHWGWIQPAKETQIMICFEAHHLLLYLDKISAICGARLRLMDVFDLLDSENQITSTPVYIPSASTKHITTLL